MVLAIALLTPLAPSTSASVQGQPAAPLPVVGSERAAHSPTAVPGNVRFYQQRVSLLGRHVWYRQVRDGRPVIGGWYARHFDRSGRLVRVWDGRRRAGSAHVQQPTVSPETAQRIAAANGSDADQPTSPAAEVEPQLMVLPAGPGQTESRLVWVVISISGDGALTSYVDAETAAVLERETLSKHASDATAGRVTGRGRVFNPNPVVALQNQSLRDRDDRTTEALTRAYTLVDLPRLAPGRGLVGRWVRIMNTNRATSQSDRYIYSRTNDKFEQVVAYFAIDAAQAYLHQLGFRDANAHRQKAVTNHFAQDNSFYDPHLDAIRFGSGGVDDAEDVEIVWHEYGHAIQDDQVPDFGLSPQSGAIGEGFGDYLAVTMSAPASRSTDRTPLACVADWDSVAYDRAAPHCLRRVDSRLTFDDRTFDIHHDGRIWSRALWDIGRRLHPLKASTTRNMANRIIVESQFWMNQRITMAAGARTTVWVARELYGGHAATVVRQAFVDRRILG